MWVCVLINLNITIHDATTPSIDHLIDLGRKGECNCGKFCTGTWASYGNSSDKETMTAHGVKGETFLKAPTVAMRPSSQPQPKRYRDGWWWLSGSGGGSQPASHSKQHRQRPIFMGIVCYWLRNTEMHLGRVESDFLLPLNDCGSCCWCFVTSFSHAHSDKLSAGCLLYIYLN